MQEHSFPTTIFIFWAGEGALQSSERRGACFPGKGVEVPPFQNTLHVFTCTVGMAAWLVWAEGLRQPLPQVSHRGFWSQNWQREGTIQRQKRLNGPWALLVNAGSYGHQRGWTLAWTDTSERWTVGLETVFTDASREHESNRDQKSPTTDSTSWNPREKMRQNQN